MDTGWHGLEMETQCVHGHFDGGLTGSGGDAWWHGWTTELTLVRCSSRTKSASQNARHTRGDLEVQTVRLETPNVYVTKEDLVILPINTYLLCFVFSLKDSHPHKMFNLGFGMIIIYSFVI